MTAADSNPPAAITKPFTDAIAEAERLIRGADFITSETDLDEGLDYLAGRIRASLQLAFDHDLDRPILINSTHQFARQGLDNPDAIYFHAYLRDDASYVVTGRRGTTADLSFQVMSGNYSADATPGSQAAFDDRGFMIEPDGSFTIWFVPESDSRVGQPNVFALRSGAKNLIIREVYDDWVAEERGQLWIQRVGAEGQPADPPSYDRLARKYEVAGKLLTGSIQTWFAFPHFFTYKEQVNTLTTPKSTPGGLASQFSSIGHYQLGDHEAMVVTVPRCLEGSYQAIQIGSDWYASTDYETHQSSLTGAQSQLDPDGHYRYVISNRNPGVANWLEVMDHRHGVIMLRWQRLSRELTEADGPKVVVCELDDLATHLPHYAHNQVTAEQYAERIAARQLGVAKRMLS
ncbi:MAG: hypothetical protein U0R21_01750 [Nocardioidaceae bacterium]